MKFCWSTLTVRDMEKSLNFYRNIVGLPLMRRFNAGSDTQIAFLGSGETQIELIYREGDRDITVGPHISWGFAVDSLDDFAAFLHQKGFAVHSGPFQPNPGTRFLYVLDPDGLKIQFVEQK